MKVNPNACFFFCFYLVCYSFLCHQVHAQKAVDSSYYYYNLVVNPKQSTDLTLAFTFYEKRKNRHVLEQDTLMVISDLRFMASIQKKLGFLYDSELTSIEALELLNHIKVDKAVQKSKIGVYNHLGIIQREYNNYDEALKFYNKSLGLATTASDSITIINNIANIYLDQKKYDQAISALKNSYNSSVTLNNKKQIARALNNLGAAQSKINAPEALANITEALKIRAGINDNIGMYSSYKHLAEYYQERNKTALALNYANKAYKVAKSINSANYINDALSHIIDLDKNPKVLEYKRLSDSLNLARRLGENKFASVKYESSENIRKAQESELKLKTSELNKQTEERLKLLYMSIAGFIIILSGATYFILKSRHRKDKLLQVYNTETRISKKVHDEVANDIYHAMTKLQMNTDSNDDVLDELEFVYNKTRDISKENSIIDVQGDFQTLIKDLLLSYKTEGINVIVKDISKIKWQSLTNEKKMTLYRVLQELMTNMRKHSKASLVALTFGQTGKKIAINYKDNGIGCKLIKNNGLRNTENRIESIKGTITFESQVNHGFKAILTV